MQLALYSPGRSGMYMVEARTKSSTCFIQTQSWICGFRNFTSSISRITHVAFGQEGNKCRLVFVIALVMGGRCTRLQERASNVHTWLT